MKRFTKMEYESPDEMVFGFAKHPVKTKYDIEIGAGYVNPIIKVAPKEGSENSMESMVAECRNIAISACQRALNVGLPSFIIEQEHIAQQTANPDWAGACTQAQVEVLEKFHDEYGIKVALKATPADIRDEEKGSDYRTSEWTGSCLFCTTSSSAYNINSCTKHFNSCYLFSAFFNCFRLY